MSQPACFALLERADDRLGRPIPENSHKDIDDGNDSDQADDDMVENGRLAAVDNLLDDSVLVSIRIDGHHLTVAAARQRILIRVSSRHSRLLGFLEADNEEEKDDNKLNRKEKNVSVRVDIKTLKRGFT